MRLRKHPHALVVLSLMTLSACDESVSQSTWSSPLATIAFQDLGTGAPPSTIGNVTLTPFPPDANALGADVTSVGSPLGGSLAFDIAMQHLGVGAGWATWSHGYTGDVYFTKGASSVTLTLPPNTGAYYLYVEPNPFATFTFTVNAQDGTVVGTGTAAIDGDAGARGFAFTELGGTIQSITVSSTIDFAVGEFGVALGPPVQVTKADIRTNQIDVLLSPATDSGDLVLTLVGDTNTTLFQGTRAGGSYHFNFGPSQGALSNLPVGQFTQVRADWTVNGTKQTGSADVAFHVLGRYRHSQYNIPDEVACPAGSLTAWITDTNCNFTQTTLRPSFIAQTNLNGSGRSISHGGIQVENFCLQRRFNPPPGANGRSFRPGTSSGTCGIGLSDTTVARNRNHPDLSCGDEVLIVGLSTAPGTIKTVTDECPACPTNQLDNFTTASACAPGQIHDLGNFTTIRLR